MLLWEWLSFARKIMWLKNSPSFESISKRLFTESTWIFTVRRSEWKAQWLFHWASWHKEKLWLKPQQKLMFTTGAPYLVLWSLSLGSVGLILHLCLHSSCIYAYTYITEIQRYTVSLYVTHWNQNTAMFKITFLNYFKIRTSMSYTFNLCPQGDKEILHWGKKTESKVYHMLNKKKKKIFTKTLWKLLQNSTNQLM